MKKDIDFEKITQEAIEEISNKLNPDYKNYEIEKKFIEISAKICKVMITKYHQELLSNQK
ncbi:hypothetical protein I6E17_08835 [Fusobacterium perfoetens]|uniref:hypothetical protein n=1 Tax=Fusobacterium perfoetens TaxID=852 RepID=UPI001F31C98E|nr:hypothetical protein [Fusobacterium perfoetens]MCF2626256.1 hypothetical protein [Fusobacterium perfoetens]